MTQIKPKTTGVQIVAARCFCCCSLRLQQYRRTHSPAPPLFVLPLKQLADTLALSARLDRRFALSNGVFHVKHRFFYCFPVGILFFFLLCILLVFSLLYFVLSDCRVCLVKHFVCFYHFCGFAGVLLPILSANTPLLFFCVRHLMWAGGVSMSFCGGYGIGFTVFVFAADAETSFARQDKRARRTVCCCMCLAAMFLFVFMLPLFACPNVEYAKLCESDKSLCGETDRRTLCRDDISIFGAVIGERFAFLCGGERRFGLIVLIWAPVAGFVLRFTHTKCFALPVSGFARGFTASKLPPRFV